MHIAVNRAPQTTGRPETEEQIVCRSHLPLPVTILIARSTTSSHKLRFSAALGASLSVKLLKSEYTLLTTPPAPSATHWRLVSTIASPCVCTSPRSKLRVHQRGRHIQANGLTVCSRRHSASVMLARGFCISSTNRSLRCSARNSFASATAVPSVELLSCMSGPRASLRGHK
jgi:hypothetical protein